MSRVEALALVLTLVVAVLLVRNLWTRGERTRVSAMVSNLQSFALHQQSFHRDRAVYSSDVPVIQDRGFQKHPEVRFVIHEATSMGWAATVWRADTPTRCYVFVGDASPVGIASERGVVACE